MIDVPSLRGALKQSSYFQTTLGGFADSENRFKVFRHGEAPSIESQYVTIEMQPVRRDRRTGWNLFTAIFHVTGSDTDRFALKTIAHAISDIFEATDTLPEVVGEEVEYPALKYELIGDAVFDDGTNPVTDEITESVALTFGIQA